MKINSNREIVVLNTDTKIQGCYRDRRISSYRHPHRKHSARSIFTMRNLETLVFNKGISTNCLSSGEGWSGWRCLATIFVPDHAICSARRPSHLAGADGTNRSDFQTTHAALWSLDSVCYKLNKLIDIFLELLECQ